MRPPSLQPQRQAWAHVVRTSVRIVCMGNMGATVRAKEIENDRSNNPAIRYNQVPQREP